MAEFRDMTLNEADRRFFAKHGYIHVGQVLDAGRLRAVCSEVDAIVGAARGVAEHNEIYDLEASHRADKPRVRRIKTPHLHFPLFEELVRDPVMTDPAAALIGENIRLYGGKINIKAAGYGAPVEWHQDWAFYPHTNDDVLTVGILLDDMDAGNGPLCVMPGSHKGPIFDHHADGAFCGALDLDASELDFNRAAAMTGKAGDMVIFHSRCVHGSTANHSNRQRRLLIWEMTAADAWPLAGLRDGYDEFQRWVIRGAGGLIPRLADVPVRMPYPLAVHGGSIYENQRAMGRQYFEPLAKI
ncbi:MAG: phytanoyl-CoA dioxygenase family protein [Alphaproteobacteria bacterium]